jgi:hypothetical protein
MLVPVRGNLISEILSKKPLMRGVPMFMRGLEKFPASGSGEISSPQNTQRQTSRLL